MTKEARRKCSDGRSVFPLFRKAGFVFKKSETVAQAKLHLPTAQQGEIIEEGRFLVLVELVGRLAVRIVAAVSDRLSEAGISCVLTDAPFVVEQVADVEDVHRKLDFLFFADTQVLCEAQVPVVEPR